MTSLSRRLLLCVSILGCSLYGQSNETAVENANTGTTSWQLTNPALNREIEGYASLTSVNVGNSVSLFVSTAAPSYTMDVYRLGWYGGTGARQMVSTISRTGILQTTPAADSFGRFECNWTSPYILAIPANWVSGIYVVKLTASTGPQSYIQLVVREDSRASSYLFQHSVTTDEAYNNWPGPAAGGKSLYTFNSGGVAAVKVSFNRPYFIDTDSHYFSHVGAGFLLRWEVMMLRWLESKGYDVTYCTNVDTHETSSLLLSHKAFLSVGHDEYWSWEMRANVEAARDQGVSIGFFSADACYWQIRLETSPVTGATDRTIVGYKETAQAGLYGSTVTNDPTTDRCRITTNWRFNGCKASEQAFIGVEFIEGSVGCPSSGTCVDMVIADGSSWALAGSGLATGAHIPGLLGYEVDGQLGTNSPSGTQVIAKSPIPILDGDAQNHPFSEMVTYTTGSGATVFSVGTFQWTWGLDDFGAPAQRPSQISAAVQKITQNVLSRFAPAAAGPDLTITKSHTGNFTPGQTGATYAITVTNAGAGATSGTVTVTDTVPAGLTATAISGTGWTCTQPAGSCTRSDALAASSSYPALTLTVNVAANAPATVTNTVTVSGGGETNTANDTASDATTIGAPASAPVTDNFDAPSLNTSLWTFVNPVGDGSVSMTGTQLKLNAPAASNHDPAFGGADNSVRVVQSIANGDFQATVKFDSIPNQQYQFEGILVEQDAANYLRFQFASSATSLHVAASQILSHNETVVVDNPLTLPAGTTSLWLRIQRAGNTWTETWSSDGANFSAAGSFTLALTAAAIGPFAGNYNPTTSAAPALSALVDSFVSGTVAAAPVLTITKSHTGNFTPGQTGATYTLKVTNSGTASTSGTVTVSDTLPAGLAATSIGGTGWICTQPAGPCTRSDVLAAAAAYPTVTLTVNVASNASGTLTNTASVSGGGAGSTSSTSDPAAVGVSADPASDDFRSLTLNTGLWTYINPLGGSYSLNGTNLSIIVQGGVSHDPLAMDGNYSSRVMQSMRNVDFSAEIKFDSIPIQTGTTEGILVQQDASNFLRFEFQGASGGTNIFAGKVLGNSPSTISSSAIAATASSLWMRVARTGSTWTLTWSRDGVTFQNGASFSQPMTVTAIGPMVGNFGSSGRLTPDFTASIDYFFNLASPVVPQDGGSPRISNIRSTPGAASAVIAWTTDENATSRVDFGPTTSYGSTKSDAALVTAHSVLLTGLTCAATLNYAVTSVDAGSATRQSSNLTFTTPPCASPAAPRSDSFDTSSLNTAVWTWVDPNNNSYLAFNGTTAQITVPANTVHNAQSPGGNGSARIVQPVLDTNFDVAAKFVSEPISGTSGQGILVEQDALNYLLFELRSDGTTASFWAASRAGATQNVLLNVPFRGHAPVWLRVTRSGTTWTLSWSVDGNTYSPAGSFQQSLAVASLGLYAVNNATTPVGTPAFTASVDAFVNTNAPLPNNAAPPPFTRIVIDPDPGTVLVQETMGDLDGDGRPDAVVGFSDPNHGLAWYRSPHSGVLTDKWDRFTITPTGESYEDVIVYDVNGDGAKDVIASIDSAVKWYENPAGHGGDPTTGVWQEHIISSNAPGENNFILKDMDGDGLLDLVTPHTIFMGTGTDFGLAVNYDPSGFRGLALLDIGSGKGAINPVGTDPNAPFSFVWFENPRESGGNARTGQWIEHVVGAAYPCDDAPSCFGGGSVANLATGDINGDGRMDLVTVQSEGYPVIPPGGIIWFEAPADRRNGTWIKHTFDPGFDSPHNVWVADIDKNGTLDVIAAQQEQSQQRRVAAFLNDGRGNFTMQILSNSGSHNPFLVDVNGDGWLDLFSAGHGRFGAPNPLELYINPRGTIHIDPPPAGGGPAAQTIAFGALGNVTLPAPDFVVSATATSGLPVTFSSTTAGVCTVSGSTVRLVAAGTCSIAASQPGNASYSPATPVTQSFAVNPAPTGGGGGGTPVPSPGGGGGGGSTFIPTVAAGTLTASPATISFTTPVNSSSTQTVALTYQSQFKGGPLLQVTIQAGGWLTVSSDAGIMALASFDGATYTYTATVTVKGDTTNFSAGNNYSGTINFKADDGTASTQVAMHVSDPPKVTVGPDSLSFTYRQGDSKTPSAQNISVSSTPTEASFTLAATTGSGGNWLSVPGAGGTTPGSVPVSVNVANVAAGSYAGKVTVTYFGKSSEVPVTLTVLAASAPAVTQGGVVPVYSSSNSIQAGSWISIYGTNLADATAVWDGDFPTSLGGVSVTINGKPAYLWFVSPTQINLQAPDDTATGSVNVVVTTSHGTFTSTVTLAAASPSFSLLDGTHAAGVILTNDGTGAYGQGAYDIVGPTEGFKIKARPAKQGEVLELFGVGFGPTDPPVPAGQAFSGSTPTVNPVTITIGGVPAEVLFAGMTGAGVYQVNVIVPSVASGDQALQATVNGMQTPAGVVVAIQ